MDYTVHGILQARILEWVAFPFSRGSSQPRDGTQVSRIAGGSLPAEPQGKQNTSQNHEEKGQRREEAGANSNSLFLILKLPGPNVTCHTCTLHVTQTQYKCSTLVRTSSEQFYNFKGP